MRTGAIISGAHVDDQSSPARRRPVVLPADGVREAIASCVLFAPYRAGARAGGVLELLHSVGAVAGVCAGCEQIIRRLRQFLDRRATSAAGARRGGLYEAAALCLAARPASRSRLGLSCFFLSAVLFVVVRRLRADRLFSRTVRLAGNDARLLCRCAASAAAEGPARRRPRLG